MKPTSKQLIAENENKNRQSKKRNEQMGLLKAKKKWSK